ncbi:PorV/PorQ family protein [bacterium]|nr:PorV/PorQ family protein [bacterium]
MKRKIIFTLIFCLSVYNIMFGATGQAGSAGAYLRMGTGARAIAMGSAFTSIADDPTAVHWNPAGAARIDRKSVASMHAVLTLDRSYDYTGFVSPMSFGSWGVSWISAGVDKIERYDAVGNRIGFFDDTENAYIFTYAAPLGDKYKLGANIKYLSHDILGNSATSWGADIGFLAHVNERIDVGATLRNIGTKMKWDTASARSDEIPFNIALGISYKAYENLMFAFDVDKTNDLDTKLNFGVEGTIKDNFAVRTGSNDGDFTAGVGLIFDNWNMDYAWSDSELGDTHRISASFQFGSTYKKTKYAQSITPDALEDEYDKPVAKPKKSRKRIRKAKEKVIVKVDPKEVIKLYDQGNELLINKKYDDAISVLKNVIKIDPNFADAFYKIGIAYVMKKEQNTAKKYLKHGLKLDPKNNYAKYAEVIVK